MPVKLNVPAIITFVGQCKRDGWSYDLMIKQLRLVRDGVNDKRLHDNTLVLISCPICGKPYDD